MQTTKLRSNATRTALGVSVMCTACALWGAPEWVRLGHAACGQSPCRSSLSAVGRSPAHDGVWNPGLRRAAADGAARAELARRLAEAQDGEPATRALLIASVTDVAIADRWIASDGSEYALAELTADHLRVFLKARSDVSTDMGREVETSFQNVTDQAR